MNGWDEGHPAWWLNLEANPDAAIRLAGQQPRPVHACAATGEERERLWQRWLEINPELDACASRRSIATPVVVFEREMHDIGTFTVDRACCRGTQ